MLSSYLQTQEIKETNWILKEDWFDINLWKLSQDLQSTNSIDQRELNHSQKLWQLSLMNSITNLWGSSTPMYGDEESFGMKIVT